MESYFAPAAIVLISLSACFNCLFALVIVLHRRRTPPVTSPLPRFPKVSVFLTLRNLDDGLEENIVSVLSSDYPALEVFFAVDAMDDPCVPVIKQAIARVPGVRSTIVATGQPDWGNPKVNKLSKLEAMSDAALFWILDSDSRVSPGTLTALVADHLRSGAHIVFSPIRCSGARTFGSLLEMSYINFFLSGSILSAWKLFRQRVVVGKSLLVDAHAVQILGGFSYFNDVLAEDHWLGEAFHEAGFTVRCSDTWIDNIKQTASVKNCLDRITRWAKLRFCLKTPVYLLEILFNPLGLALLLLPFIYPLFFPLCAAIVAVRLVLEYLVFFSVNDNDRRRFAAVVGIAPAVVVKDLMMLAVYFVPFFNRQVLWRGRKIGIKKDSRIVDKKAEPDFSPPSDKGVAIVTVHMGLGHLRAAYPLLRMGIGKLLSCGSRWDTPAKEYRIWRKIRRSYYFLSRAEEIPLFGNLLARAIARAERIEPYYSAGDQSKPTFSVRYLDYLIRRRGLCRDLVEKLRGMNGPFVHTYFATAIAADKALDADATAKKENYLLICDSDFNRVWVPKDPRRSNLRYCVPCSQARRRLVAYGVPNEKIYSTGFPLPVENLGGKEDLATVKDDVFQRLLRLDPQNRFFGIHDTEVMRWLGRTSVPLQRSTKPLTITFAIGGAGAQTGLACAILRALRPAIRDARISVTVSVGIQKDVLLRITKQINLLGLAEEIGKNIRIVFDIDHLRYFDKFNACMRTTDVLWTKPSELVFYAGLGIPILLAPSIGTHEELNRYLLQEIHAGIEPPGSIEFCEKWLFDLRDSGRFAESAWDGFLKARKQGAFKIERLVLGKPLNEGLSPLDR